VDQAVRACTLLERWTAKGYVNGVLRNFLRERMALEARIRSDEEARYQHPRWWIDDLRRAYPESWEAILAAGNAHPPMTLRVNARRIAADAYAERLALAGLGAQAVGEAALLLARPGAQRAARLLDLARGQRVLDACAAPGGKSAHILERADVALTALDADPARCERMERNLRRLGLHASVRTADCTQPQPWWDGAPYERILADVPCTASGIARRHPDLK
jgi:16S rRNA (cytosine967-C5)-methyltransferase